MTETIVELQQSSIEGRLYYTPDKDGKHNILIVQSAQPRQMANCVNIEGGILLLYFDNRQKLQEVEFGIPRKNWQKLLGLLVPDTIESSDIFLQGVRLHDGNWKRPHIRKKSDGSTIKTYEYEHQVTAVTNPEVSAVQITIGSPDKLSRWISLSEHCWAQITDNYLKGFFIKVSD